MPKTPILSRTLQYTRLRDKTVRLSDWNIVSTTLGMMVEPRRMIYVDNSKVVNMDIYDTNFTDIKESQHETQFQQNGTGGEQLPSDYNTQ